MADYSPSVDPDEFPHSKYSEDNWIFCMKCGHMTTSEDGSRKRYRLCPSCGGYMMWIIGSSKEQAYSLWKERGKKKRIKIIQCSSPDFWYKDFIGYVFEVETVREDNSYIIKERPTGGTHCVEMCDCVVIEEEKEEEIDNINLMELL